MPLPELISPAEAAEIKGCTRQGIHDAMRRGKLNTYPVGRLRLVVVDQAFKTYHVQYTGGRAHKNKQLVTEG